MSSLIKKDIEHREWWLITFRQRDGNIVVTDGTLLAAVVGETVVTDPLVMRDVRVLPDHVRAYCNLVNDTYPNIVVGEYSDLEVMVAECVSRDIPTEVVVVAMPGIARLRIVVDHSEPWQSMPGTPVERRRSTVQDRGGQG